MGCCGCFCDVLNGVFKYVMFFFNLVFVLGGITILILGVLIETNVLDISQYVNNIDIHTAAIVLMVSGGLMVLVAFFGCCGAISNDRCLLNTYASILLVALCLQVAGFILVLSKSPNLDLDLEKAMKNHMKNYPTDPTESNNAKKFWDIVQQRFECCGVHSRLDWQLYNPAITGLPDSCKCQPGFDFWCSEDGYNERGCFPELRAVIFDLEHAMAWVAMSIAIFEVVVGVLTLMYANGRRVRGKESV
ncbi:leukocyte surface antigen CD53-like [Neocloeon triangulifer]|uniref:leukocyte surface antigen CD53-like n=1 Tax=Neocloeon triangulifer TaxID=2078957 RepID=UPI00286F69E0|nr:leukocyte surface antigen CD53-like [Neocloeon triangulifer]